MVKGLTKERYAQMRGIMDEDDIKEIVSEWGAEQTNKGYGVFEAHGSSTVLEGAAHIEAIMDVGAFDGDWDACRQAEKDGVKFIDDMDGLEKGCYIDTPENREICRQELLRYPSYRIEVWLDEDGEYGKTYIARYGKPRKEKKDAQ